MFPSLSLSLLHTLGICIDIDNYTHTATLT